MLMIYLFFSALIVSTGLAIGPPLVENVFAFGTQVPEIYSNARTSLRQSAIVSVRLVGERIPAFERVSTTLTAFSPQLFQGVVDTTTGAIVVVGYFFALLAIAFYWTLKVPRFERLVLFFVPVDRRAHVLNVWHEIEFKLGAFLWPRFRDAGDRRRVGEQAASHVGTPTVPDAAAHGAVPKTVELPLAALNQPTDQVEHAAEQVEAVIAEATTEPPPKIESIAGDLERAAGQIKEAVDDVDAMVLAATRKAPAPQAGIVDVRFG